MTLAHGFATSTAVTTATPSLGFLTVSSPSYTPSSFSHCALRERGVRSSSPSSIRMMSSRHRPGVPPASCQTTMFSVRGAACAAAIRRHGPAGVLDLDRLAIDLRLGGGTQPEFILMEHSDARAPLSPDTGRRIDSRMHDLIDEINCCMGRRPQNVCQIRFHIRRTG